MTESTLSAAADPQTQATSAGEADLRAGVHDTLRGLAKAWRAHLLYEGNSPALDRMVDQLRETLRALFSRAPFFTVAVEERELLWNGISVYHGDEGTGASAFRENLAFAMYRDGLREVSFHKGFEREELDAFLGVLARISRVRDDQDDLLTLLWDRDWYHLRYRYVEGLPEGTVLPAASGAQPEQASFQLAEEQEEVRSAGTVSPDDFRGALYFLDAGELRRVEAELEREMGRDVWVDVLNALFDRIQDSGPLRQEQIVGILGDLLPTLLGSAKLETAALLLSELVSIATSGQRLALPVMRQLRALFDQLADAATVAELVRTVEESGGAVDEKALSHLLSYFPPEALGPLLRVAETSASPAVRRTVQAA
ncbi:MAG TPA: hypothetical protein VJT67_05880, partial [Longimicrobiaceae bacterium]|nr:hypothetical protein [Longimicrobiaceae bacterium]